MNTLLAVAAGSAAGGACRYLVDTWVSQRLGTAFPWGTLIVNISGALLAGMLAAGLGLGAGTAGPAVALLIIGFCGSYTTVSSYSLQGLGLLRRGHWGAATAYLVGSVGVCLLAAWFGYRALDWVIN